jgi:ectoine hydroxylase
MKLNQAQLDEYNRQGFLFFPGLLSPTEMGILSRAFERIVAQPRREIVLEKDGKTVRSVFNMQTYDPAYANLVRHPNVLGPVGQILGVPAYVFQLVLNVKAPFNGDEWPWHQDYPTYRHDDGMARPAVVNTLIFVDEVNEFNSPLMMIPGSHLHDFPLPEVNRSKTSYPGRWLPDEHVDAIARKSGIVAPKGPAGSVIFMHTNVVHGSGKNYSPWRRALISLTLNAVGNEAVTSHRPDYIVPADHTPLEVLNERCLLELA